MDCTPHVMAAASSPLSNGSSEKYSKIAAAQRVALDVHARPEQHADVFGAALLAQRHADGMQQVHVP